MLKLIVLAITATLCLSQDPEDYDFISCDDCQIPNDEFPEEGEMVCFTITKVEKLMKGRVWKCTPEVKCDGWDIFCVPQEEKCDWEIGTISIPSCQLERKIAYKPIDQIEEETFGIIYQIYSPRYFGYKDYSNNTYCVWNVANEGYVSYHMVDQQLQEPFSSCNKSTPGCKCPHNIKITMGANEISLCSNDMSMVTGNVSPNGLQVKFCSDNKYTVRGFHLLAYKIQSASLVEKREITTAKDQLQYDETSDNATTELDHVICHYEYMMRLSQPDVRCPDDATLKAMLQYHNHLMSISSQDSGMCNGMTYPSSMMPMMNKIERCAVEYLYRSRDCEFAKMLVNSSNGELSGIAHAIVENHFLKSPKWMNIPYTKCS